MIFINLTKTSKRIERGMTIPPLSMHAASPPSTPDTERSFADLLHDELQSDGNRLISTLDEESLRMTLRDVRRVYLDLDGTMLTAGSTEFSPRTQDVFRLLLDAGIDVTFLTGKPYTEIRRLIERLPPDLQGKMRILYEKGAYRYDGHEHPDVPVLTDDRIEEAVSELKEECYGRWAETVKEQHGVRLVPAGDGSHRSVLSFDLFRPDAEIHAGDPDRRESKIQDTHLIAEVYATIDGMLKGNGHAFAFALTDLGNANFEVQPIGVDKDAALQKEEERFAGEGLFLTVGDSGNDRTLFEKARSMPSGRVGLVYHDKTPEDLLPLADVAVTGHARGDKLLAKLGQAQGALDNVYIVSNTPSLQRTEHNEFKNRMGAPLAIGAVVRDTRSALWFYPSETGDAFLDYPDARLNRKFKPVRISKEEFESQYNRVSNDGFWRFAHPLTFPRIEALPEEDWRRYEDVSTHIAAEIDRSLLTDDPSYVSTHDFQVLPVASEFRKRTNRPAVRFGLFWHVPMPSAQEALKEGRMPKERIVRMLEWMRDYDVIGFHTQQYVDRYLSLCRELNVQPTKAFVKPISIDVDETKRLAIDVALARDFRFTDNRLNDFFQLDLHPSRREEAVIAMPERADPIKGGPQRLGVLRDIAERNPQLLEGKRFLEMMVPTRMSVDVYRENFEAMESLVAEINRLSKRTVVHTVERIDERQDVIGAMYMAKKAQSTSVEDGFNMTVPEYLVTAAATRHFKPAKRQIFSTGGTGIVTSWKEQGMPDVIPVVPSSLDTDALRTMTERLLRGELREPNYLQVDRYTTMHDLHGWVRENVARIMDLNFSANVRYAQRG